jgi:hypothetical protein
MKKSIFYKAGDKNIWRKPVIKWEAKKRKRRIKKEERR